ADAWEEIGDLYYQSPERQRARIWYEKSINILILAANANSLRDDWAAKLKLWKRMERMRRLSFGPADRGYAETYFYLGDAQYHLNQYQASLANIKRGLAFIRQGISPDEDKLDLFLFKLGDFYTGAKEYDDAERLYLEGTRFRLERYNPDSIGIAAAYDQLTLF